jgi:transposase
LEDWGDIIWTDESRFEVGFHAGTCWVSRAAGEEDLPDCLLPSFKSDRTSVMIWGAIKLGTKRPMVILLSGYIKGPDYVKLVMISTLHPFYIQTRRADGEAMVMEDGASIHRSVIAREARNRLRIQRIPWPAQSPDLNPIENLWRKMKYRINLRTPAITTKPQLIQALQEEWDRFTPDDFKRLIESMPRRVRECIKRKGASTHY